MTAPRLTRCELEIMDVVWARGRATVQEVRDGLSRPLAYTTVMTTLSLLERHKGVLERAKRGRAYVYTPLVTREEVSRGMLAELRDVLFGGSTASLMLNILSQETIPSADFDVLKAALAKLEESR